MVGADVPSCNNLSMPRDFPSSPDRPPIGGGAGGVLIIVSSIAAGDDAGRLAGGITSADT